MRYFNRILLVLIEFWGRVDMGVKGSGGGDAVWLQLVREEEGLEVALPSG